ncbi:ABC transporter permease [Mesoplasma corruscae]|uniref:Uncharacterized protein n=1 Tax=Mesoplasma corruscae TaxID=216874 RepID=A0A2S5RGS6_9MOLU|nr:ABC transporter permease [Mesoplasma corruscae]PPE06325.1 hypothetical protein MCORR_v1c06300 [Mesoplasma corruscae]
MVEEKHHIENENFDFHQVVKQKLIKYRKISFTKLMKFSFKSLLKEKLFYILNISILLISIAIGILLAFIKSGSTQVVVFNFFILFFICCLMFVFILRMVQFFFNKNFEDKTTYIVLTNQVSRIKFFIAQYFLMILIVGTNILVSFLMINSFYSFFTLFKYEIFILRMTIIYAIYSFIATFFIINFVTFLIFIFSLQTTTIICTLLLALSFIANIPMSFTKANEKSYNIQFENSQLFKLNDIYDAYTLNDSIAKGNIKYSNLSKYIYDYFIEKKFTVDDFSSTQTINDRIKLWSDLGLINSESTLIKASDLNLFTKPLKGDIVPQSWQRNDKFNMQIKLKNTFISETQLDDLILKTNNQKIENILIEFKQFTNEINEYFKNNLQYEKYDLFDDFLFLETGVENSYLEKINASGTEEIVSYALQKKDVQSIYKYAILGDNSDGFKFSNANDLVKQKLNFNLMYVAQIIEKYFIKYSSNYIFMSSNPISKTSGDWNQYISGRKNNQILSYFNLYNGLWMNYTQNLGFYNKDIWFAPSSDSKIYLEEQKNLFLGYPEYTLKLDSNNNVISEKTTTNYIKAWYYLAILFVISLLCFLIALYKFKKFDF